MERGELRRAVAMAFARTVGSATVLLAVYYVVPVGGRSGLVLGLRLAATGLIVAAVVWWQVRAVSRATLPWPRAVEALAVTVTVTVVAFSVVYLGLSRHDHAAFDEVLTRTSALYFTLTTLTTVGYGDIHARTDVARIAVMIQLVANVAVVGAAVKLILGMARHRVRDVGAGSASGRGAGQ